MMVGIGSIDDPMNGDSPSSTSGPDPRRLVVRPQPFRFKRWSSSKSDPSSFPDAVVSTQQRFIVLDLTKPRGHRITSPATRARARVTRTRDDDA